MHAANPIIELQLKFVSKCMAGGRERAAISAIRQWADHLGLQVKVLKKNRSFIHVEQLDEMQVMYGLHSQLMQSVRSLSLGNQNSSILIG